MGCGGVLSTASTTCLGREYTGTNEIMKATTIVIGIVAAVALVGIGIGWIGWRGHNRLVTLKVRNAPLAEVTRKLEQKTGEKIRVDPKLDGMVTLDVKNMPLGKALDLVSEQTGARWGKTYAVYDADSALRGLEAVFRGDSKLEEAGWTNLAPRLGDIDLPGLDGLRGGQRPVKIVNHSPGGADPSGGFTIQSDEDVQKFVGDQVKGLALDSTNDGRIVRTVVTTPDGKGGSKIIRMSTNGPIVRQSGPDGSGGPMRQVVVRRTAGPGGITTSTTDGDGRVKIIRASSDGTILSTDEWSPERLVLETLLSPRLGDSLPAKASRETAAETARKVRGKYVTYYALEKPPFAMDPGMSRMVRSMSQRGFRVDGTNNPMAGGDIRDRIAAEAKERKMEELSKSPEQQVQRARQKQEAQTGK
jgi:hypothetical protein